MEESPDDKDESPVLGALARSVRGLLRPVKAVFRVLPGNLPARSVAKVAKVADNVSQVVDIGQHIQVAKGNQQKSGLMKIMIAAVPNIVKSAVLGTALFSAYDYSIDKMNEKLELLSSSAAGPTTTASAFSGAFAGGLHGLLSVGLDRALAIASTISSRTASATATAAATTSATVGAVTVVGAASPALIGTVISHAVVHASMFGGFVLLRNSSFIRDLEMEREAERGRDRDRDENSFISSSGSRRLEAVISVGLCGAVAGALAEFAGSATVVLETHGVREGLRMVTNGTVAIAKPPTRVLALGCLSGALGMLAYELGSVSSSE